jgi:hypothetical protein
MALMDRYIDAGGSWDEHLIHSKKFILRAIQGKQIENLAVYGSGWLLDFPLEELASSVSRIQLYDLIHPPQVLQKIKKFRNVQPISVDLTGNGILEAYYYLQQNSSQPHTHTLYTFGTVPFVPPILPDYTVSLNILSQLGAIITDSITAVTELTFEEIRNIHCSLQQAHLKLLRPGRSCLLTDTCERYYDLQTGCETGKQMLIYSLLPDPQREAKWQWDFDLQGSYKTGCRTMMDMQAMEL